MSTNRHFFAAALALLALAVTPVSAQVRSVDPDAAIDADLSGNATPPAPVTGTSVPAPSVSTGNAVDNWTQSDIGNAETFPKAATAETYGKDDLIGAAEGVFGKGAQGLAGIIEDILRKQGEPNGYITGREAGGAIAALGGVALEPLSLPVLPDAPPQTVLLVRREGPLDDRYPRRAGMPSKRPLA